jgi:hypothetical protein
VTLPSVAEGRSASDINLAGIKPAEYEIEQEALGADLGKGGSELEHYYLIYAKGLESAHLLLEGLKELRRPFGMKDCPGMRIKSSDC